MLKKKLMLISILGSVLIATFYYNKPNKPRKTTIVNLESVDKFNIDTKISNNLTVSYVIDTMEFQPEILNKFNNSSTVTPEEKQFILLYKDFIDKGTSESYYHAENGFNQMSKSNNKALKEYGEYGLSLMALIEGNMKKLKEQINKIESLNEKSEWLTAALLELRVSYYYEISDYTNLEKLVNEVNEPQLINSSILLNTKIWLYLKDDRYKEAEILLKKASYESRNHINMVVLFLEFYKGDKAVIDFLKEKKKQYPDSHYLEYLYNFYLMYSEPAIALENLQKLVNENDIDIFLQIEIAHLLNAFNMVVNNELSDQLISNFVANEVVSQNYINGILFYASLAPFSGKAFKNDIGRATVMNEMNYSLLWLKLSAKNIDERFSLLKKLEHIDPYYNLILIELARYYDTQNMNAELLEIKQRFDNSPRYKTQQEIRIMSQY